MQGSVWGTRGSPGARLCLGTPIGCEGLRRGAQSEEAKGKASELGDKASQKAEETKGAAKVRQACCTPLSSSSFLLLICCDLA